jgi:hypothetical protein
VFIASERDISIGISIEEDIFSPPPTKDIKEIVNAFKKSGLYNQKFTDSLEKGLKRSAYFK